MRETKPPRWDLSNIYPGLETEPFKADLARFDQLTSEIETYLNAHSGTQLQGDASTLSTQLGWLLDRFNQIYRLSTTMQAYIFSFVSTDSFNQTARRIQSEFEQKSVRLDKLGKRFESFIGKNAAHLEEAIPLDERTQTHAFFLRESAEQSRYLMSEAEESLASELNLSGARAWNKLQGTVTSQMTVDFELDGEVQQISMPALVNLRSHPDGEVRRRAYEAENSSWEKLLETLAAAMNGIKGSVITLNRRRGREDCLHSAIDAARIDRETLETMLDAMRDSFPMFHRYFRAKAARLGKERLPWYDLFAPMGKVETRFSYDEAVEYILEQFDNFSPELAQFAKRAFDQNWVDAEQRPGKRGGAFCMDLPAVKESRILSNYDGSLDSVFTLAHELGHAFHNECINQAGKTELQAITPMTLAETASIMCETIVFNAVIQRVESIDEELAILETSLISDAQVIVDIYSRYLFEKEVFERREEAELSADEFNEVMERAQKATYGDGLDEAYLQKYMWTWKPHYYSSGRSFYNFPYAFGALFGYGLYAIYKERGSDFVDDYKALLASTGEATAADLAARFGIDIRARSFWDKSLAGIGERIKRYQEI